MSSNEIEKGNKSKKQCQLVLTYKTCDPDHLIKSTKFKKPRSSIFNKSNDEIEKNINYKKIG
jgi:hypothetical protein